MKSYQYFLPTKIVFGRGSLVSLKEQIVQFRPKKLLLVAGGHLKRDGTVERLINNLDRKPLIYKPEISKSDIETIDKLVGYCREKKPDLVIAIGGGTILDTTKAAAILATNSGSVSDCVVTKRKAILQVGIPVLALPTTAGTGSEVTPFVVVWDTRNKKKYSLDSPLIFPKVALVDPSLTDNLPPKITASTGMDALTQAIEAYWSKNHNPISDVFALKAIWLTFASLEKAVNNPNKQARDAMAQASLFSGLAFSNTKTTICHSVSYPITVHFSVPHGHAVALTLSSFLEYSYEAIEKDRGNLLLEVIGEFSVEKVTLKINRLMKKIGLETKLSRLGIKKADIQLIVDEGFHPDRAGNAPKVPSTGELQKILEKIL